jgi:hypothetical protein
VGNTAEAYGGMDVKLARIDEGDMKGPPQKSIPTAVL